MNKQILTGNIGNNAEIKEFQNGNIAINFSVAHTVNWVDKSGQKQEVTKWIECVWYNNNTSVAQYLQKGTKILVEGEPAARAYTNQSGEIVIINQCVVKNIEFLSSKQN